MPVSVTSLGHDLYLIDGYMHGEAERLACYLFDTPERVVVECGPTSSLDNLFAALDEVPLHIGSELGVLEALLEALQLEVLDVLARQHLDRGVSRPMFLHQQLRTLDI